MAFKQILRLLTRSFPALLCFHTLHAQVTADSLPGEYHLTGVAETASALLLNPDSTFEIYYSYGAVDRQGKGVWKYQDGKIILNSRAKPQTDFSLIKSEMPDDTAVVISIVSDYKEILPFFEVLIRTEAGTHEGRMNSSGVFRSPGGRVDSIDLFFALCPERYSSFQISNTDRHFQFRPEPWIMEIFAENIPLTSTNGGLKGGHPLLKGQEFVFQRTP